MPKDLLAATAHGRHPYTNAVPALYAPADRATNKSSTLSSPTKRDTSHSSSEYALIETRLVAARTTHRLDLSLSASSQFASPTRTNTFQRFPQQVIAHAQLGHRLTELWLTNHRITVLPPELALLTSLRVLGLGGNALSALPDALGALTNLDALFLERNCFRAIAADTPLPSRLRELRLDCNQLTEFPNAVTKLRLLNCLSLSHNAISVVPREVQRLRCLVELELDYNRLGPALPLELAALTRLERLGLDANRLGADVQQWVATYMPGVTYVRLNGNRAMTTDRDGEDSSAYVPLRHDGYFQCTQRYRQHGELKRDDTTTKTDMDKPLEGLVSCRDQNVVNAELYRVALARGMHRNALV